MHPRITAVVTIGAALILPAGAHAGAPNYDCVVGHGAARIAIDQWAPDVVVTGFTPGRGVLAAVRDVNQDGPRLDITTTIAGVSWSVAIRRFGGFVRVTSPGERLTGRCVMIPGNFILRAAHGAQVVRARPSTTATRLAVLRPGAAIWERPTVAPGGWLPVFTVAFSERSFRSQSGWLRQRGLYQLPPLLTRSR